MIARAESISVDSKAQKVRRYGQDKEVKVRNFTFKGTQQELDDLDGYAEVERR
jgi:hypothetical protein